MLSVCSTMTSPQMMRFPLAMFLVDKNIWFSDKRGFQFLFNVGVTYRLK